jgi:hypothetical protein
LNGFRIFKKKLLQSPKATKTWNPAQQIHGMKQAMKEIPATIKIAKFIGFVNACGFAELFLKNFKNYVVVQN